MIEERETVSEDRHIPLNTIRKIIEKYCSYHISTEAVIKLRDVLEEIASKIAKSAVEEFDKLNRNREYQGLRPLKRLNSWCISKAYIINYLKSNNIKNWGLQSNGVVNPDGENMPAGKSTAKPDTTNDSREVV
jgi:hypothetical protein